MKMTFHGWDEPNLQRLALDSPVKPANDG